MYKTNILKINNNLNLDLPYEDNLEKQTNNLIAQRMSVFNMQYQGMDNPRVILFFDDTPESIMCYHFMKGLSGIFNFNLYIFFYNKTNKIKKRSLPGMEEIKYHKFKHIKNKIVITPFNPITNNNVSMKAFFLKNFTEVFSPLDTFSVQELIILYNWYVTPSSIFYDKNFENKIREKHKYFFDNSEEIPEELLFFLKKNDYIYNFYQINTEDLDNKKIIALKIKDIEENNEDLKAINFFILNGNEKSIKNFILCYNFLVEPRYKINKYNFLTSQKQEKEIKDFLKDEDVRYYNT